MLGSLSVETPAADLFCFYLLFHVQLRKAYYGASLSQESFKETLASTGRGRTMASPFQLSAPPHSL